MYGVLLILNYNGLAMEHIDGFATEKDAEDFGKQFVYLNTSRRFYVYELAGDSREKPNGNYAELNWTEEELVNKIIDISIYLGNLVEKLKRNPLTMPFEMDQAVRAQMLVDDIKCHAFKERQVAVYPTTADAARQG